MRDLKATIEGTLHGGENLGAESGALEADVEVGVEGGWALLVLTVNEAVLELGGDLLSALELLVEAVLLEKTTSAEKTDAVGGGVVGETNAERGGGEGERGVSLAAGCLSGYGWGWLAGRGPGRGGWTYARP